MSQVLAVASGKGGVGKTWFSISLGQALVQMNRRVLLVDCDVGLANIDVQLGLNRRFDMTHAVTGEVPLVRAIQKLDKPGFDVLPGRSGGGWLNGLDPLITSWLKRELRALEDGYDFIILDLPSGIEQGVRDLMRHADDAIILTTNEPTALTDAYALIKATRKERLYSQPHVVINFARDAVSGRQTLEGLVRVCDRFLASRPRQLGVIRQDSRVFEAIGRQMPLLHCYPGCNAALDVIAVAENLLASNDPE